MKISNRPRALGIIAAVTLALLLGDKLVIGPVIAAWKARATKIAELNQEIAQGKLLLAREETIRERWESMRTNTLPDNVSAAENEVLQAFEHWSQVSQISIASIKPQWKRSEDYLTLECRADAYGSIDALARFLYNVERDPLALKVDEVEITARDNDGQQLSLGVQVSGVLLNPQEP